MQTVYLRTLPWASKNSSSELSSESRAMLCILHSEMLWRDGLTVKPQETKGLTVNRRHFYFSSFFLNKYTTNKATPHHQSHAQTWCYINMQQFLRCANGLHNGQGWCVKSETQRRSNSQNLRLQRRSVLRAKSRFRLSHVYNRHLVCD